MNNESLSIHGVLLSIDNIGIIIRGKSGIGKSECAAELINKGAKLVADDLIIVTLTNGELIGASPEKIRNLIEIRGIGILNVKDIFGALAVMKESKIHLIIDLIEFNKENKYDRLGYDTVQEKIMSVPLPKIQIPVSPGRNVSTLIEIALKKLKFEDRL
jgi:HPr kinase/phosphorylase